MSLSDKTILAVSVGTNLLLAGMLAGGFLLRGHQPPPGPPPFGPPGMERDMAGASPELRALFSRLDSLREGDRDAFDAARKALIAAIEAPVFDPAAYDRAEDQMRTAHDNSKRRIAGILRTALASLPLADRKAFADRLRRMPPPPGGDQGGGPGGMDRKGPPLGPGGRP